MAVAITGSLAGLGGAASTAGMGAMLTNPVGWLALGANLLMSLDAQDQANAQRTEAYNIQTKNLLMQRDEKLAEGQRKTLAAQDEIVEKGLENMLSAMQQSAKVKSASKGQMNTKNMLRLIKSGELQTDTKLNQAYNNLIKDYNINADNVYNRTAREIERLSYEYATQDQTLPLLMNTVMGGYQLKMKSDFDLKMTDLQKKIEKQAMDFDKYINANKGQYYGG